MQFFVHFILFLTIGEIFLETAMKFKMWKFVFIAFAYWLVLLGIYLLIAIKYPWIHD